MRITSEPIFAVNDVAETIRFYREVLGFDGQWLWGTPPTFGAASWGNIQVMFCKQPGLNVEGHQHFFRVDDVGELHERHVAAGAPIIEPLENKPWGTREYTVRDPNGYHLRFGGPATYTRPAAAIDQLPDHICIDVGTPPIEVYAGLRDAVGWNVDHSTLAGTLEQTLFCVVAIDRRDNEPVGMLRVCGDGCCFMIYDVMVRPAHQGQRIGTALVERAIAQLRETVSPGGFLGLFTPKPAFYERLGFRTDAGGMHLRL